MFYTVVLLDGKELHCLTLEEVKDLFIKRQLNQDSLICSAEDPTWQMLKRTFDISQWIASNASQAPPIDSQNAFQAPNNSFEQSNPVNQPNNFPPQNNPFEQTNPVNQPVTFNQFPPNETAQSNNPYAQNTANGYSQNNQTETYYQAESSQSQYNFQNNQPNVEPSKYNNTAGAYYNPKNPYGNSSNFTNDAGGRKGLRQAAVFLIVWVIFNIIYMLIENLMVSAAGPKDPAETIGSGMVGFFISVAINLILAVKLWKQEDVESARKWVLVRSYLGFIIFGIAMPFTLIGKGEVFVGVVNFIAYFLFLISILLVLHGKQGPSQSRLMVGTGTFALFFLFNFGVIALSSIVMFAPNLSNLEMSGKQYEKYKIEGKEYVDKTNGAKVVLPEGWSMISLDNPLIHTPEARMIAIDKPGNRLTMLEVVPVPGNLDLKRQNSALILDQLADGVVQSLSREVQSGGFGGANSFKEITRINIYVGAHPAKLLVIDKTTGGLKAKGHLIITYDELTFYVLHSWCPAEEYDKAQAEFTFFEKNFTVPEKINSTFTQSAETQKNNANTNSKKNF